MIKSIFEVSAMTKAWKYNLRCGCGRFVKPAADNGTMYGGVTDIDEPEPEYYCPKCAKKSIERSVQQGYLVDAWYRPPKWVQVATQRLSQSSAASTGVALLRKEGTIMLRRGLSPAKRCD